MDSFPSGPNAFEQNGKLWPSLSADFPNYGPKINNNNEFYYKYFKNDYSEELKIPKENLDYLNNLAQME